MILGRVGYQMVTEHLAMCGVLVFVYQVVYKLFFASCSVYM